MKKILAFITCLTLVMALCTAGVAEESVYKLLYAGELSTLNYLIASTQNDQVAPANTIDTLVEYDCYGNLIPSLALSWSCSDDGLVWTFLLREGVKWVDYLGNPVADVTAHDFVAAAKYIVTAENESPISGQMDIIKNAEAYYDKEIDDFSLVGVKALDDYTLEYTLESPTPYFLSALTYVNFLPAYGKLLDELGKDFATSCDKLYYCGAYRLEVYEPQVQRLLVKNELNWDADNVFIDKIQYIYNSEAVELAPTAALRGEVDYAEIMSNILDEWKATHPELLSRDRAIPDYSYFYSFNFNPLYEDEYAPDNWLLAVNNANFRHSIMSAFDRLYAMSALAPDGADALIQNTITPATFAVLNGVDYAEQDAFKETEQYFFNPEMALAYKAKAIEELTAAGAVFPIQVVLSYRVDQLDWEQESILLKQQVEGILGTDYVQFVLRAGPSTDFLATIRRGGLYSLMRCNWGADYQDPETFAEPFGKRFDSDTGELVGNTYNRMDLMLNTDFSETIGILEPYYETVEEAKAETSDMEARYAKFAEAEAMLIGNAIFIPYYISPAAYQLSKINVFEGSYASFGMSILRYKGQKLYDSFITAEQSAQFLAEWQENMSK